MDPVSLILAALVTGAADAVKNTASEAVKDAYRALRSLLRRRFSGEGKAEIALDEFERDHETWEKPLAKSVAESGAADDEEIRELAQRLLDLAGGAAPAASKYTVNAQGSTGVQIGD